MKNTISPSIIWLIVAGIAAASLLFYWLSPVLLPFIVAGLLAYMLNPIVNFFQHRCRLHFRSVAVVITLALLVATLVLLFNLVVPPLLSECGMLKVVVHKYFTNGADNTTIPQALHGFFKDLSNRPLLHTLLREGDLISSLKSVLPKVLSLVQSTTSELLSMIASMISVLYLFFLLLDYERYARGWISWIPVKQRKLARQFINDAEHYFCGYFRGQVLIALSNCVMFTIGFLIVGFPMPVALGCFIGVISFIPYLQVVGMIPAFMLALLQAATSGENFWWLIFSVILVYLVVQIIQDVVVTPRVMGSIMGLSPAIILLSLSLGGYMLGIMGLIIALPLTTIGQIYYRRYLLKEENQTEKNES